GHTVVIDAAVAPTCTATGLTEGSHCSVCNAVLVAQEEVAALGHDEIAHEAQAATCTEKGWNAYVTCSRCNYTTYEELEALGHDIVIDKAVEATCTETGLTEGQHCSRCDKATVAQQTVEATGHNYICHVCSICDTRESSTNKYTFSDYDAGTQYAENEEHVLDENVTIYTTQCHFTTQLRIYSSNAHNGYAIIKSSGVITALDFNAGYKSDTLNVYGSTDGESWTLIKGVSITSTSYEDYSITITESYTYLKLDVDGGQQVRLASITLTTATFGHDDAETTETRNEATCTEAGSIVVTCNKCGETISTEEIPATGHDWNNGEITTEATCTEDGEMTYTCTANNCGETKTEEIPATGHADNNTDGRCDDCGTSLCQEHEPIEDDNDCTTAITCSVCGETITEAEAEHLFDNACDADCNNAGCEHVRQTQHTPAEDDGDCTTAITCTVCGETTTEATTGHTDGNDEDFTCDNAGCTAIILPEADTTLTIAQAIALGKAHEHDTFTSGKYYVTGTIKEVYNTQYGNMRIYVDDIDTTFTIYRTYSADGTVRYDALLDKPVAGEQITLYGVIGQYDNTPQMKNAWIAEHALENATCTEAAKCTICGQSYGEALGHAEVVDEAVAPTCTETGLTQGSHCSVCGKVTVAQETVAALGHVDTDPADNSCDRCEEPMVTYTASFVVPAGEIEDMTGGAITMPTAAPVDGYTFVGWSTVELIETDIEPTVYLANSEYGLLEDTTFYAVYSYTEGESSWMETAIADIISTNVVVITMTTSAGTVYALTNDNGTGSAPTAVVVTVANDKLSGEVADNIKWNVANSEGSLTIYPNGTTSTWLYCTSSNNGVRVGTNSAKVFTIDASSGYLKHTGTSRYVGVYTANPDWRCYTNTTGNTANQTLRFYVLNEQKTYYTTFKSCGHANKTTTTVDATCTEAGSTTVTCDDCGETISTEEIPVTDHTYVDGKCSVCGAADPNAGGEELEEREYTYTFTSKQFTANGTTTLSNVSWTLAGDGGYWGYDGTKGQQLGSGSAPYKTLTLSTDGITGKIKSITINTSGASSINGSFTVAVGGIQYGESTKLTTTATEYTFNGEASGEIVFSFTQSSSKALYIKSITIVYEA
ncbi:MAG: hypothetical protein IJC01_04410, partial [Clostridia bacterium]|nr:hypothetical protein [Clostridia bacterium]